MKETFGNRIRNDLKDFETWDLKRQQKQIRSKIL